MIPEFTHSAAIGKSNDTLRYAEQIAGQVQKAWHDCGHTNVEVWVETLPTHQNRRIFTTKSNLVNGLPPKEGK